MPSFLLSMLEAGTKFKEAPGMARQKAYGGGSKTGDTGNEGFFVRCPEADKFFGGATLYPVRTYFAGVFARVAQEADFLGYHRVRTYCACNFAPAPKNAGLLRLVAWPW